MTTIYVYLRNEGTDVWRPVEAEHLGGDAYRIVGTPAEGEEWEFGAGEVVRCSPRMLSDGEQMVAVERAG